jgi:HEAT repeat protein
VVLQAADLPAEPQPATAATHTAATPVGTRSPRILELLSLAEANPTLAELQPFLDDPDSRVRRAAVVTLSEIVPDGAGLALAAATADKHGTVRHAAVTGLRELVEVLPPDGPLTDALNTAAGSQDAVVRAAVLDVLRQLRTGETATFHTALADADRRVRLAAVRGLVSRGESDMVAAAAADQSREVRIAAAGGLGTIGGAAAHSALRQLAADADPLVRAAAFTAAGRAGCPPPLDAMAVAALADEAWQVRVGAAGALAAATAPQPALIGATADPHPDVRKAAVISLTTWSRQPDVRQVLHTALTDTDADVRAHARHALAESVNTEAYDGQLPAHAAAPDR